MKTVIPPGKTKTTLKWSGRINHMNTELTELVFILDRSGSMGGLESDTINGFNGMIARQKEEGKQVNVTTVLFDDEVKVNPFVKTLF